MNGTLRSTTNSLQLTAIDEGQPEHPDGVVRQLERLLPPRVEHWAVLGGLARLDPRAHRDVDGRLGRHHVQAHQLGGERAARSGKDI